MQEKKVKKALRRARHVEPTRVGNKASVGKLAATVVASLMPFLTHIQHNHILPGGPLLLRVASSLRGAVSINLNKGASTATAAAAATAKQPGVCLLGSLHSALQQ